MALQTVRGKVIDLDEIDAVVKEPIDGGQYLRQNGEWILYTPPTEGTVGAPGPAGAGVESLYAHNGNVIQTLTGTPQIINFGVNIQQADKYSNIDGSVTINALGWYRFEYVCPGTVAVYIDAVAQTGSWHYIEAGEVVTIRATGSETTTLNGCKLSIEFLGTGGAEEVAPPSSVSYEVVLDFGTLTNFANGSIVTSGDYFA